MKIREIVILVGDRQKVVTLPPDSDLSSLIVRVKAEDGTKVEFGPMPRKTGATALVETQRALKTARQENMQKARDVRKAAKEAASQSVQDFLNRLSPPQRHYAERLFDVLQFRDEANLFRAPAVEWIKGVLDCCPEPWRLDFKFLRLWLSNPYSAANKSMEGESARNGIHIKRAVARKEFIKAWEEQVGPISIPSEHPALHRTRGVTTERGNHPFTVLFHSIQRGEIKTLDELRHQVREYQTVGALQSNEVEESERMISLGRWMGELALPIA